MKSKALDVIKNIILRTEKPEISHFHLVLRTRQLYVDHRDPPQPWTL